VLRCGDKVRAEIFHQLSAVVVDSKALRAKEGSFASYDYNRQTSIYIINSIINIIRNTEREREKKRKTNRKQREFF